MGTNHWRKCWQDCMSKLNDIDKQHVLEIIHNNVFSVEEINSVSDQDALKLLSFYTNYRRDIITEGTLLYKLKMEYDKNPTYQLRRKKH